MLCRRHGFGFCRQGMLPAAPCGPGKTAGPRLSAPAAGGSDIILKEDSFVYQFDLEELAFFEAQPAARPLYEAFAEKLFARCPDVRKKVGKSQIAFSNRHVFACISFLRVRRKADLPDPFLVLTLGLPFPLESDRVAAKTQPWPGRWTTHLVLGSGEETDEELFEWVRQAYLFAAYK